MTTATDTAKGSREAAEDSATGYWIREIALFTGLTVLLALDLGALECEVGMASLDHVALHLWGPAR